MRGISSLGFHPIGTSMARWSDRGKRASRHRHHRHTPRKRGIQYAAAFRLYHGRWWNTGSSAFADDDIRESRLACRRERAMIADLDLRGIQQTTRTANVQGNTALRWLAAGDVLSRSRHSRA